MDKFVFVTLMSTWAVTLCGLASSVADPPGIAAERGRIESLVRMPLPEEIRAPHVGRVLMKLGI